MAAYSSDEDLEMGMFEELELQEQQPHQFNQRDLMEILMTRLFVSITELLDKL